MISRQLKRVCADKAFVLPPTFLLPFTANLSTVSHTTDTSGAPEVLLNSAHKTSPDTTKKIQTLSSSQPAAGTSAPPLPSPAQSPPPVSQSIKDLLPALRAQGPHYITAHIYDRPYLLTAGDTVRLPFLMHGVNPGDILRLNRASSLGSREFTLKAAASAPNARSPTASTTVVVDPTPGSFLKSESRVMEHTVGVQGPVDHFVPHKAKGQEAYLDERLFTCRAVVMGVESEPMRIKEKTKRRQRRVKTVHSKHRFTVLRIKEVDINSVEEVERQT